MKVQGLYNGANNRKSQFDIQFDESQILPVIVFCHGYKGYKDWGPWNYASDFFLKNGMACLKFNFSHNGGTSEEGIDFPDLDAFGQNRYSYEVYDFTEVLAILEQDNQPWSDCVDLNHIYVVGHSRGGGVSILGSHQNKQVAQLCTWASVADFESRFPKDEAWSQWKKDQVMYVQNGRTKQEMPHRFSFYLDFYEHQSKLNIQEACSNLLIPYLIVHGTNDGAVNPSEAELLHLWSKNSKLEWISGSNHTFETKHPWQTGDRSLDFDLVLQKTIDFFKSSS